MRNEDLDPAVDEGGRLPEDKLGPTCPRPSLRKRKGLVDAGRAAEDPAPPDGTVPDGGFTACFLACRGSKASKIPYGSPPIRIRIKSPPGRRGRAELRAEKRGGQDRRDLAVAPAQALVALRRSSGCAGRRPRAQWLRARRFAQRKMSSALDDLSRARPVAGGTLRAGRVRRTTLSRPAGFRNAFRIRARGSWAEPQRQRNGGATISRRTYSSTARSRPIVASITAL
jgi:hypothetical protein